jgi:hypothetical protein
MQMHNLHLKTLQQLIILNEDSLLNLKGSYQVELAAGHFAFHALLNAFSEVNLQKKVSTRLD